VAHPYKCGATRHEPRPVVRWSGGRRMRLHVTRERGPWTRVETAASPLGGRSWGTRTHDTSSAGERELRGWEWESGGDTCAWRRG
jgi:hypothetical protein